VALAPFIDPESLLDGKQKPALPTPALISPGKKLPARGMVKKALHGIF
jgi:hypothetical protein